MKARIVSFGRIMFCCIFLLGLISPGVSLAQTQATAVSGDFLPSASEGQAASPLAAASTWCAAGSMEGWNGTPMYDDGTHGDFLPADGIFTLDMTIANAGYYEWKVKDCSTWDTAFPPDNSWFVTSSSNETVKLTFDTNDHSGDAGWQLLPAKNIVAAYDSITSYTAVGTFQGWNNADPATTLKSLGHGLYWLSFSVQTAGSYMAQLVPTGTWNKITPKGRVTSGDTFNFTTTSDQQMVVFIYDSRTGRTLVQVNGAPGTATYCVGADFNGWNAAGGPMHDDGLNGDLLGGDGIYSDLATFTGGGFYQWKATDCTWSNTHPASGNAWFTVSGAGNVLLTLDTNNHASDADAHLLPKQYITNVYGDDLPISYTAVGDFQGWDNSNPATLLSNNGAGQYKLLYTLGDPKTYTGKIVLTGSWNAFSSDGRSVNAPNVDFTTLAANDSVLFALDVFSGRMIILPPKPKGHSLDNIVEKGGLGHDSHSDLYRAPFGAVPAGDSVTLRFRTYHNDVEQVKVRFWDTTANGEFFSTMDRVASKVSCYDPDQPAETCDYWQLLVPTTTPTTLYYRFIVRDGTSIVYYADDGLKYGGWGAATDTMVDNSYVITVYEPGFAVNDWMRGAVVYQVFPDRFRNGLNSNDPSPLEPRYNYPNGQNPQDDQIIDKNWGDLPEGYCRGYTNPATPCTESPRGRDYFGGDLYGLTQKLIYLKALGVKVIYLNPVFESASNHGYDTQNYLQIDHFFGNNADFKKLAAGAHSMGMKIILDGVFNHVSSDSPYMDRYSHYANSVGACESLSSPYRGWFTFHDVAAGTGVCAGAAGPLSATYDSWFGFDSLPVLNKNNPQVVDLIYDTNKAVARYWLAQGADGWRLDVMGDSSFPPGFWQAFRGAVLAAKPDAIIIGELWKKEDVLPMIHGDVADTTMNYRFRNAVQGFFGAVDNKGFPDDNQKDQPPSLFAEKLTSIREDYPDATYYTLMNLMDSHDTQRILWNLTPGANNREDREFNAANLAAGKQLLRLAVVVQMTVPGAPTIYYGDEVGVTGFDDPDDRRTFPWGKTGMPPYYGAAGDHALLDWYRMLTAIRNSSAVFKDGKLTFLLTDDANRTLAYLMRTPDGAAVVAMNRSSTAKSLSVSVKGLLPNMVMLSDALGTLSGSQTAVDGVLTFNLPALSAAVLLPAQGQDLTAPAASTGMAATASSGNVSLDWADGEPGASYNVYRSFVTGGGYELVANTATSAYADTSVTNGTRYYYVVKAVDAAGNEGSASNEAFATPSYPITAAKLQWPFSITEMIQAAPTENVYGQVEVPGVTNVGGDPGQILAQLGFGAAGTDISTWTTWKAMSFNVPAGTFYEYVGNMRPEAVDTYDYMVRFSTDNGETWTYGTGIGVLTVTPNSDTTPPAAPANLMVADWSSSMIKIQWDSISDAAEYWVYRHSAGGSYGDPIAKVTTTSYTDADVITNETYTYKVIALDAALNKSADSNEVTQTAAPKMVNVTFRVRVPAETPAADVVYIAGDSFAQQWNPGNQPMSDPEHDGIWEWTTSLPDGKSIQYKYTRGSWDRVEWWGTIVSTANRLVTISYGSTGSQVVDNTATDWGNGEDSTKAVQAWRDPLVASTVPANGYSGTAPANVTVAFAGDIQTLSGQTFDSSVVVTLGGSPVSGKVSSPDATHLVWTPASALVPGAYTVTVFNVRSNLGGDSVLMQAPYVFTFTVN